NVGDYGAVQVPDIVGSLRVDQAWGSAQIAGALHQVRAGFYGNNITPGAIAAAGTIPGCTAGGVPTAAATGAGGNNLCYTGIAPADKWGYAAMAGIVINLPWAKGDQFWVEGVYSVGAASYTGFNTASGQISHVGRFND